MSWRSKWIWTSPEFMCVRLNSNFGWTLLELLMDSAAIPHPHHSERKLYSSLLWLAFVLNLSTRSMVTCTQSAGASPEKVMKMFWGLEHFCGDTLGGLFGSQGSRENQSPFQYLKGLQESCRWTLDKGSEWQDQGNCFQRAHVEYWEEILPCESCEALAQVALPQQGMEQGGL